MNKYLSISSEVKHALKSNLPIVALESTIIAHGMPYPENVETAVAAEKIIRDNGCVPATIAILNGKIKVGLSNDEIDLLGKKGYEIAKTTTREIPYIIMNKLDGATTAAATMHIASMAKIKIFATGGIGGVHRGAEHTFDISSDLDEIARTDVAVVSAGAKSILDLAKTLEYLETKGVPVVGYKTNVFPAFYSCNSPHKVTQIDSPEEIANLIKVKSDLGIKGGVFIANPIPQEYAIDEANINYAIDTAITEMEEQGIVGKDTTPYLLSKITELTGGNSLKANIQLFYNNCLLACEIAKSLEDMK